jgi:hypothetical protein
MDETNNFKQILCGRARDNNIETAKNIRIFLSSTFSGDYNYIYLFLVNLINIYLLDTHAERDYLIEKIYPQLKTYCKKEYGLDFQVYILI